MAARAKIGTEWQWSEDVLKFAGEQDVRWCLEPILEATRRIFPTGRRMEVYLSEDPEIRGFRQIVFDVQTSASNLGQTRDAARQWNCELIKCCPEQRLWVFVLVLDLQK